MRSERVAVILVEMREPPPGKSAMRLFDVIQRWETVPDELAGSERPRIVWEIVTDESQIARAEAGLLRFPVVGAEEEATARPRVFLAVRSGVQRDLQMMLGGIHGFCG